VKVSENRTSSQSLASKLEPITLKFSISPFEAAIPRPGIEAMTIAPGWSWMEMFWTPSPHHAKRKQA
jgi:hypothetical protein